MKDLRAEEFYPLLGCQEDSPLVKEFIKRVGEELVRSAESDRYPVFLKFLSIGIHFSFDVKDGLTAIFLFNKPCYPGSGEQPYPGTLPKGLHFDMSRSAVREFLGFPGRSSDSTWLAQSPFDRYDDPPNYLFIYYSEDKSQIDLVTIVAFNRQQVSRYYKPDPYHKENKEMNFAVIVEDNSHFMDDSETYKLGEYRQWEEAEKAAKAVIDSYLKRQFHTAKSAENLITSWKHYGETPKIMGEINTHTFSAIDYVEKRCVELFKRGK